jgi:hypothetical protein
MKIMSLAFDNILQVNVHFVEVRNWWACTERLLESIILARIDKKCQSEH